jgi:ATP-dependent helicase/nuclease subunit A
MDMAALDPDYGPLIRLRSSQKSSGGDAAAKSHLGWSLYRSREGRETEAERLRLFYVACTRAADLLILSAGIEKIDKPRSRALKLLSRRFDLQTGLTRRHPETGASEIPERSLAAVPVIFVHTSPPQPITPPVDGPVDTTGEAGVDRTPRGPAHFAGNVRNAEPAPWPESALPIPVDVAALNRRSVSDLEQVTPEQLGRTGWFAGHPEFPFEVIEHRPATRPAATGTERTEADAERLGTLVHAVLERLPTGGVDDLERAIQDAWGHRSSPLSDELRAAAVAMLEDLLASPLWSRLVGADCVEREVPFIVSLPDAEMTWQVTGSIDLLVGERAGNGDGGPGWSIYDYKTSSLGPGGKGRNPAARQARARELLSMYELQLGAYAVAIAEWSGRLPDGVSLVLVANGVTELRVRPTEEFLVATRARLAAAARFLQRGAT